MSHDEISDALRSLLAYAEKHEWRGYDPYDGLNSELLRRLPGVGRTVKLAVTQGCKRSPINLRGALRVARGYNAKALALFLSSYARLCAHYGDSGRVGNAKRLVDLLRERSIPGYSGGCWGYNFDWQSRTTFIPEGTPNAICTAFVANAFLDAHEILKDPAPLDVARSACDFLLNDLNRTERAGGVCFSYTPLDTTEVYNVSLIVAALLARVYTTTRETDLLGPATEAVRFAAGSQNADGSWYYSPLPWHQWIDNIHTGFNLVALADYTDFSRDHTFRAALEKGFQYYFINLFTESLLPKYYAHRLHPIDVHSVAQAIVTFARLGDLDEENVARARAIAQWAIDNMRDENGFFYFQKHRHLTNKIAYMRWGQAWMSYALTLLETASSDANGRCVEASTSSLEGAEHIAGDGRRVRTLAETSTRGISRTMTIADQRRQRPKGRTG